MADPKPDDKPNDQSAPADPPATNPSSDQKNDDNNASIDKKFIVISGITSGIGAGMLRKFTKMGHIVAGFGRRKDKILALRKELNILDNLLVAELDITKHDDILKWGADLIAKYGAPNLVIHNAGSVVGCNKNTWDLDMNDLMKSYQIHIAGSVIMTKTFIPKMREVNAGTFINITSWAGSNGYAEGTPYCSSKFALEGLTKCLAEELKDMNPTMCACAVSPGFVNTDMLKGSFAATAAKNKNVENGDQWAEKCCDWLLGLNAKHTGRSLGPPLEKESMKKYCDFFKQWGINMEYEKYIHPSD